MSHQSPVVLIAGPTASGKSALALALAERLGGIVVNADSMQVYRDLRVITARPSAAEEACTPHRLYGHVDAAKNYSVGGWCRDVAAVLADTRAQGRIAVITGGTGLYFSVLTSGLAAVPPVPPEIRASIRQRMRREGVTALHAELARLDPETAHRVMPKDGSRIGRALEVFTATGRALSDWHREGMPPLIEKARAAKVFLDVERTELVTRIEARFDAMLAAGALEEVKVLAARGLDPQLPAMKAHGVPWLVRHLEGALPLEAAAVGAKMDTRRYAKRQVTWFRNQLPDWPHMPPERAEEEITRQLAALSG